MPIKEGFCRTDTDGLVYRREDTVWAIVPTGLDPGVLDFKDDADPVPYPEYWDSSQGEDKMKDGYPGGFFYPHYGETIG